MNKEDFKDLRVKTDHNVYQLVGVDELQDKSDRTLIWGYTCDRDSFHVYLKDEKLFAVTYKFGGDILNLVEGTHIPAVSALPDKRVYPEACDLEFCNLLLSKGAEPPFTTFNDERPYKQFHGKLVENLNNTVSSSPSP